MTTRDAPDLRKRYRTGNPVVVRPMRRRWISDVPSKMVKILQATAVFAGQRRLAAGWVSTERLLP
jgi:hypothetical protein